MKSMVSSVLRSFLALIALLVLCPPSEAVVLDRIVAKVNDEAITWLELYEAMERELAPKLKGLDEEARREALASAEAGFLDSMIVHRLQIQEAAKQDIFVSEQEVESTIDNIRTKYGMGLDEFRKAVEDSGSDWYYYRQNLREQIVISKLVDKEVKSRLEAQETEESGHEAGYHLKQIFIKAGEDEDEVRRKVKAVYDALESGSGFDVVAMSMSEGPNAPAGGDLGVVDESSLSEAMRQALRGVAPGEVASPVMSGAGVHILKVESRVGGQGMEAKFQEAFEQWLKGLRDRARVNINL